MWAVKIDYRLIGLVLATLLRSKASSMFSITVEFNLACFMPYYCK